MSIFGAMNSAVSGLFAQSQSLGMISDNISNVNTVGYKGTVANFSTLVTANATVNSYSPGGVRSRPLQLVDQQGLLQASSTETDVAVSGRGFFVVNESAKPTTGDQFLFTRAGSFRPDENGDLVNAAGFFLQGWPTDINGNVTTGNQSVLSDLKTINVSGLTGLATATTNVKIGANLPATDATGVNRDITVQIFDSLGVTHNLTLRFTKTATANQWTLDDAGLTDPSTGATTGTVTFGPATVTFNGDGSLASVSATSIAISAWTTGASNSTITLNLGTANQTDGMTQFSNAFQLTFLQQDGARFGNFSGVTIGDDGTVVAQFDNGEARPIFRIPLVTFANPSGLETRTGNAYTQTDRSGQPLLQTAGTGNAGKIESSTLEASTVDLADEFTKMIVTQRAYAANARIITTADQMLEELIRIR